MKLNILQLICLINYVFTFPNDLFDELWETNQSEPQTTNNPIESQPKIKVEPHEELFDGRWQNESSLEGNVKVEHEPDYGSVKVEELNKNNKRIFGSKDASVDLHQNDSNEFETIESGQQKREIIQKFREMKEDYKKKRKYSRNEWIQIERKISNGMGVGRTKLYKWMKELGLSREIQFKSKFSELEKNEILKQFEKIKSKCKKAKLKNLLMRELDDKIAKKLGVSRRTICEWKRKYNLYVSNKKFSESEKRQILKQFDEIKSKCKKAKLKNISMRQLDEKIAKKLGVSARRIYNWKCEFGLSVSNNKFSDATKMAILNKYAKIKEKNPKMRELDIADLLKISISSLTKWKAQFRKEIKHL